MPIYRHTRGDAAWYRMRAARAVQQLPFPSLSVDALAAAIVVLSETVTQMSERIELLETRELLGRARSLRSRDRR